MIPKLYYVQPKRLYRELRIHEVDEHRRIHCIFYDLCLDTTTARKFTSFSCKGCKFYVEEKIEDNNKEYEMLLKFIDENPEDECAKKLKETIGV